MVDDILIKQMASRFLQWRLPADFDPDNGIVFDPGTSAGLPRNPVGTNLLTAPQAEAMVRHMLEGLSLDDGLEKSIKFVEARRDAYVEEHGSYDWSTGVTEYPGNGDETVQEWEEIIDGLRALSA